MTRSSTQRATTCPPKIDGRKATKLDIRFSGSGALDRTSDDDLALLEAMRMGQEVRLIVTGAINGKGFRLGSEDEELAYSCTVKVLSVEAGEIAWSAGSLLARLAVTFATSRMLGVPSLR